MKIFNTLSGQKEDFLPQDKVVKMYVCGITPYDYCHMGHAMSYIIFDVIRRYIEFRGNKVRYVQNFTDIDDKIIARANQKGISPRELADRFIDEYLTSMDSLNIKRADTYPKATEEIPKIVEMVQGLIDKGHAYKTKEGVYFRVASVPDYGKLSHRNLEKLAPGARVEPLVEKEHPLDFALWKTAKPGEPSWESPWGKGRPGWHIECSAMSLKYHGNTLDIHGGGQDLIFPHHENEIAQTESFTGVQPFVKYWLHNGLVQMDEEKMSKSLGNLITLKEALSRFGSDAIRLFVLSSHYRSPITYDETALDAAGVALGAFSKAKWKLSASDAATNRSMLEIQGIKTDDITLAEEYRNRFISAMDDDFNTAQATATLFGLAQEINRAVNLGHGDKVIEHREILKEFAADVLGLILPEPEKQISGVITPEDFGEEQKDIAKERGKKLRRLLDEIGRAARDPNMDIEEMRPKINLALGVRESLRKKDRQFELADEIRAKLEEAGIILEDTQKETRWRYRPKVPHE